MKMKIFCKLNFATAATFLGKLPHHAYVFQRALFPKLFNPPLLFLP